MLFNASIGLLKFCLDDLFINVRGVLKCHTGKESAHDTGDLGSILGLGRSSGEGHDNPLQYSCLENAMGRGAWWATVHRVTESDTTEAT